MFGYDSNGGIDDCYIVSIFSSVCLRVGAGCSTGAVARSS